MRDKMAQKMKAKVYAMSKGKKAKDDGLFSSDEDVVDDTHFIDNSYYKIFCEKATYEKDMDYV